MVAVIGAGNVGSALAADLSYLHEDVGWGLVPWMHLAAAVDCPTPTIAALVQLASVINGLDYARQGLTLQGMGFTGRTVDDTRAHVGAPPHG